MRAIIATVALALLSGLAQAAPDCEAVAAEKKLAGAAKNSFMKKCEREAGKSAAASFSHFFTKLFLAAPASFFSEAFMAQASPAAAK